MKATTLPPVTQLLNRRDLAVSGNPYPRPQFEVALLQRYDLPLPSYACYPGTRQLSDGFGETDYRAHVQRSNGDLIPRQLSLYVHIPRCLDTGARYGLGDTAIDDFPQPRAYVENLRREIGAIGRLFDRDRSVVELHLGGGTTDLLGPTELDELLNSLASHFHFGHAADRDFSITLNPRLVDDTDIGAYAALGLNRAMLGASLGARGLDSSAGHAAQGKQDVRRVVETIDTCHAHGFRSVKVDIFYGPARGALVEVESLLTSILAVRPERLAFCRSARFPSTASSRQSAVADPRDAQNHFVVLAAAFEQLLAAGYEYIGLDTFALPGDDLLRARRAGTLNSSFVGYTAHGDCDLVGLGASAFSHIADSISQNPGKLRQWEMALDQGRLPVARGLSLGLDDIIREDVIQQMLCQGRIDIPATEERHYIDFDEYFAVSLQRLQPLIEDCVVECHDQYISATSRGRSILRIIAACFDRYASPTT